jgi:hypothetical protein
VSPWLNEAREDTAEPSGNKRLFTMSRRAATMTPRQFDAALEKLGLSVYASAKVLCVSLRQAQRYSSGEAPVPPSIAKLLRALIALGRVDI